MRETVKQPDTDLTFEKWTDLPADNGMLMVICILLVLIWSKIK